MSRRKMRRMVRLLTPVLIALAIPMLLVCCTPKWLPNGKGFVYVAGNKVMLYDLTTKQGKELATTKSNFAGVAIWPTGDRVAIAEIVQADDKLRIGFSVYDLKGELQHASRQEALPAGKNRDMYLPYVYVSADGRRMVAFLQSSTVAVVYDLQEKQFRTIQNVSLPAALFQKEVMLAEFSPLTPDGKGFLAARPADDGKPPALLLYKWDQAEPETFAVDADVPMLADPQPDGDFGIFPTSRWEMGMLVTRVKGGLVMVDPRTRKVSFNEDETTKRLEERAKKDKVFIVSEMRNGSILQVNGDQQLQVWDPRRPDAAKDVISLKDNGIPFIIPSPDGQRVLLRIVGGAKDKIIVVDGQGDVLANIQNPPTLPR